MTKKEIYYTICPVGNASHVSVQQGFLAEELDKIGYQAIRLQSLSPEHWSAHFTYENDRLFREGGNTPPMWAKSRGTGVVLIGVNIVETKQAILVRADSDIYTMDQLKGKRLAIPVHTNVAMDFHKSSAEHGFEIALAACGIGMDEVEWVDITTPDSFNPAGGNGKFATLSTTEADAMEAGLVDAIYEKLPEAVQLENTGKFRIIYDVAFDQDAIAPVNNEYPNILTVSKKLAEEEPEVVVAYVKASIRAARWAAENKELVEPMLADQTYANLEEYQSTFADGFYQRLEVNFDEAAMEALQNRADFLYTHGYLESRVDVEEWADRSFLQKALQELAEEA